MNEEDIAKLRCSFCGKSQHEVRKLIAGPTVYICDECIGLCNDIIAEESRREPGGPPQGEGPPPSMDRRHSSPVSLRLTRMFSTSSPT